MSVHSSCIFLLFLSGKRSIEFELDQCAPCARLIQRCGSDNYTYNICNFLAFVLFIVFQVEFPVRIIRSSRFDDVTI